MAGKEVSGVELPPKRSFLTESHRDYLLDETEFSGSNERSRRYEIRENFKSALIDCQLLWHLDDTDIIRALKPMAQSMGVEKIDERAIENQRELADIDLEDVEHEDIVVGTNMQEGLIDLLALFTYVMGPEDFGRIVERGINKGSAMNALRVDEHLPLYDLQLHPVDADEKSEQYDLD